jgi:hypothetical protein
MSELYVYSTEGSCIHPETGEDAPNINRYFEGVNLTLDLRSRDRPTLEVYFRAFFPDGRPEQLFLRFVGDDPASLFVDCRRAVQRELVEGRGWTIRNPDDRTDASMLLEGAVLDPPFAPAREFDRDLSDVDSLLEAAVGEIDSPLEMYVRDYESAADLVRSLDTPVRLAVVEGDLSIGSVDVVLRQRSQQAKLSLSPHTQRLLAQVKERGRSGVDARSGAGASSPLDVDVEGATRDDADEDDRITPGLGADPEEVSRVSRSQVSSSGGGVRSLLSRILSQITVVRFLAVVVLVGAVVGGVVMYSDDINVPWIKTPSGNSPSPTDTPTNSPGSSAGSDGSDGASGSVSLEIVNESLSVKERKHLTVRVRVEDISGQATDQTVNLSVFGKRQDSTEVDLSGDNVDTVSLQWKPIPGDRGEKQVTVGIGEERVNRPIQVKCDCV